MSEFAFSGWEPRNFHSSDTTQQLRAFDESGLGFRDVVGAGVGSRRKHNAGVASKGAQIVKLRDRPPFRIEAGVEMTHHDFLHHEVEEIALVIAGHECVHR